MSGILHCGIGLCQSVHTVQVVVSGEELAGSHAEGSCKNSISK